MLNKLINYESRERHVTSKKNAPNKLQVAEDESEAEKLVAKLGKLVFREAAIVIRLEKHLIRSYKYTSHYSIHHK